LTLGNPEPVLAAGLFAIFAIVLLAPFFSKKIQNHLEVFLFAMGVAAISLDHFLLKVVVTAPEAIVPSWNLALAEKALTDPVEITLAVLAAGIIFHFGRKKLQQLTDSMLKKVPLKAFVFGIVIALGLLSSFITAIIAALVLVEVVNALKLERRQQISLTIVACFAIGLGAALTPVGEPLSTIVIRTKLDENFWYLFNTLGKYIIPTVVALGALSVFFVKKRASVEVEQHIHETKETMKDVGMRTLNVYIFVMAIVFLGIGFTPIIEWYIKTLPPMVIYWVNSMSAILDNATLASAEIVKDMAVLQIKAALMALLISGGMLIPGNIPNIISASKLRITSREWAKLGVPLGMILMAIFFGLIFFARI
jgi:predicted cation transporter